MMQGNDGKLSDERVKALRRLEHTLNSEDVSALHEAVDNGEATGYASFDRPWDVFYEENKKDHDRVDEFLNTTPYIGFRNSNQDYPDEIALEYFGAKISFGEILKQVEATAKAFKEYGVKKGDFVTICSTTTPEVIYAFYAISKIGAVANVVSPFYSVEELLALINACSSKMILMVDKFIPKFSDALNSQKDMQVVVLPMMSSSPLRFITKRYKVHRNTNEITWKSFLRVGEHRQNVVTVPYEYQAPAAMVYSSGTTGASKGILLSVDSFQKLVNAYGKSGFDTSRLQKIYQNIPPWHSTGLSLGINFPLSFGVRVCTDPRFDHNVFIKNVLKFRPEYILSNTSMYQGFTFDKSIKLLKGKSLAFLKYPVEGGEPLTEKDINNIENVFRTHGSSARLMNGYGECECGATVTTDITSHKFSNSASGIPLPEITTVAIVDNKGRELKYGERGNIIVKTAIGMIEYYKNPDATEKFFYVDPNGDKWSKTGDIGYINPDGSLVVQGRKSDFSIINGKKIYRFDVERAILTSKNVKLCEIQPHPNDENKLVAHIVWENDIGQVLSNDPDKQKSYFQELQNYVRNELQDEEAVPYMFKVWTGFPSAHSGKRNIKLIKNDICGVVEV